MMAVFTYSIVSRNYFFIGQLSDNIIGIDISFSEGNNYCYHEQFCGSECYSYGNQCKECVHCLMNQLRQIYYISEEGKHTHQLQ